MSAVTEIQPPLGWHTNDFKNKEFLKAQQLKRESKELYCIQLMTQAYGMRWSL